jgi:hypothetical protein
MLYRPPLVWENGRMKKNFLIKCPDKKISEELVTTLEKVQLIRIVCFIHHLYQNMA